METKKVFDREGLKFYLPNSFKKLSKKYILDCIFDERIQRYWRPKVGDVMVGCTGNVFVISGSDKLVPELGGTVFFFGGSLCNRDGGIMLNSTSMYLMNKNGTQIRDMDVSQVSKFADFRYVPYPHEKTEKGHARNMRRHLRQEGCPECANDLEKPHKVWCTKGRR